MTLRIFHENDLELLNLKRLKSYIIERLSYDSQTPKTNLSYGEEPVFFIIDSYRLSVNENFKNDCRTVFKALINKIVIKIRKKEAYSETLLSNLLYVIESFRFIENAEKIEFMVRNSKYMTSKKSLFYEDLYSQCVLTLGYLQTSKPGYYELWKRMINDEDFNKYKREIFICLRLLSFKYAIENLKYYIASIDPDEIDSLKIEMRNFIFQYKNKGIDIIIKYIVLHLIENKVELDCRYKLCIALFNIPKIRKHYANETITIINTIDLIDNEEHYKNFIHLSENKKQLIIKNTEMNIFESMQNPEKASSHFDKLKEACRC